MSEASYLRALARFSDDIKRGAVAFDYRTGACGPVQATQLKSWGAGCPSGYCPPGNLPAALGRWFAGDRAGCKEIPYTLRLDGNDTLENTVTLNVNAPITMCPTRIMAWADDGTSWRIKTLQFGNVNQIVGGPAPHTVFGPGVFAAVPLVPDCMAAGQPIKIEAILEAGEAGDVSLWVVFLGPSVG